MSQPSIVGRSGVSGLSRRTVLRLGGAVLLGSGITLAGGPAGAQQQDEYDILRMRYRELYIGSDVRYPEHEPRLAELSATARDLSQRLIRSDGRTMLWPDLPLDGPEGDNAGASYARLLSMAQAWATTGTDQYGNADLVGDIISGLDFLHAVAFNEAKTQAGNWWWWEIGMPGRLARIATLLYDHLSTTQLSKYLRAIDAFCPNPDYRSADPSMAETGANRADKALIVAICGFLGKSSARLQLARDGLSDVAGGGANTLFRLTASGAGLYADGSYVFHTYIPYTGTYGNEMLGGVADMVALLGGSTWEIVAPDLTIVLNAVDSAFEPLMWNGLMMDCVRGRAISRQGSGDLGTGRQTTTNVLMLAAGAPGGYADRYKALAKGWIERNEAQNFLAHASIPAISLAKAVLEDASVPSAPGSVASHVFAGMDRVVHRRPTWAFAISMSSRRIAAYESINGENRRGWYLGEGVTYLYNDDLAQFNDAFWPTVDPYRLPGITVDTMPRLDMGGGQGLYTPNAQWVGGAALDDRYVSAGMSHQADGSELESKKSWFCLDAMVVALGAGINGGGEYSRAPVADARVNGGAHADTNYGDSQWLLVKNDANPSLTRQSFLRFDLGGLRADVASARLVFHAQVIDSGGDIATVDVHRAGDGWEEDTVTWTTRPSIGSRLATRRTTATGGWLSVDVTDYVRGRAGTGQVDFAIIQPAGQGLSVQIGSREHRTLRPVLRFTLAEPVETVETIVENRHLHASGTNALTVDGTLRPASQGWSATFPDARWAHLEGVGGYLFPGGAELHASRAERTGSWSDISTGTVIGDPTPITRRYLTMWFDHGSAPEKATYAYALLPGATAQQTADRAEDPGVRIVANNDELQAIQVNEAGGTLFFGNFWVSGDGDGLTTDAPAAVVVHRMDGKIRVAVSDPKWTASTVKVTLPYPASAVLSADPTVTVSTGNRPVVTVNVAGSAGRSHQAVLAAG